MNMMEMYIEVSRFRHLINASRPTQPNKFSGEKSNGNEACMDTCGYIVKGSLDDQSLVLQMFA